MGAISEPRIRSTDYTRYAVELFASWLAQSSRQEVWTVEGLLFCLWLLFCKLGMTQVIPTYTHRGGGACCARSWTNRI